jgi:endonuclease/exonuclease/phosphatase family metal-dependent hydrolase
VLRRRFSWGALAFLLLGWAWLRPPVADAGRQRTSPSARSAPAPSLPRTETRGGRPSGEATDAKRLPERSQPAGGKQDAFASAESCAALVGVGQRLPRAAGTARFASWNLHWFPDGVPGRREAGVDLGWLACALTWLDADVVAVQEVKQTPAAVQALAALLGELNRRSGARYVARLDDCERQVPQHVGLIWNEARVTASDLQTVAALNPHGSACQDQLRPGLAARFRLPGGLDLAVVSAHFKSMADRRAFALRRASFQAVPGVLRALTAAARDTDFLLLGDLNTMGCEDCEPRVAPREEVAAVEALLRDAGVRLVPADAAGSELYGGQLTLLDHALAATAMRELGSSAQSHLAGACAAGATTSRGRAAKKLRRALSDHCPLVLDLADRDLD